SANGQVFLSNPNGVLFAPGASVDVGALFATSLSIADKDFLAGRYNFSNAGNAGTVVNQGQIITANGYAALAGPQVRNDGVIIARAGTVALAAGDRVSLDMVGDGLIKVSVDEAALNASAVNSGRIEADGGNVILTARSANALLDTVVNNSGVIRANSLIERNGEIVLDGGEAGTVATSGTLSAAGTASGTTGGTVKVLGEHIELRDGARVDVSGHSGGGVAMIGGNFHGEGPEHNAQSVTVAKDAVINADAVERGDGGRVSIWADQSTEFAGTLSIRGGAEGGDGGFGEISGKVALVFSGKVDGAAPHGNVGEVVMDPATATVSGVFGANTTVDATGDIEINDSTINGGVTLTVLADHLDGTPGNWDDGVGAITNLGDFTITGLTSTSNLVMYAAGGGIGSGAHPILTDLNGGNLSVVINPGSVGAAHSFFSQTSTNTINLAGITTAGNDFTLNSAGPVTSGLGQDIDTRGAGNGGNVEINVTGAGNSIDLQGDIFTTGADNGAGTGFNAGSVLVTAQDGAIDVAAITAKGGSGTGGDGGLGGSVTLRVTDAADVGRNITASGAIDTSGGLSDTGTGGAGGAVTAEVLDAGGGAGYVSVTSITTSGGAGDVGGDAGGISLTALNDVVKLGGDITAKGGDGATTGGNGA